MTSLTLDCVETESELLSAEWVIAANNKYVDLTRGSKRTDYGKLFGEWRAWLKAAAK